MTRERKVYPRDMVAHLWANASQDEARDSGGNMYFTGPALFSYGSHFVIGYRMAEAPKLPPLFIMHAGSYSNTTSKMQHAARQAVHGSECAYVDGLRGATFGGIGWRRALLAEVLSQAGDAFDAAGELTRRSGKRDALVATARTRIDAAERIADHVRASTYADKDDKAAARRTLAAVAKARSLVDAYKAAADNNAERETCTAAAALLTNDKRRAEMVEYANRAHGYAETVDAFLADHAAAPGRSVSPSWAWRSANDCAVMSNNARSVAKRYGFRAPKLPDAAALVAAVQPHYAAEYAADALQRGRAALEACERDARRNKERREYPYVCDHYATQIDNLVTHVAANGGPGSAAALPRLRAWSVRAAHLCAKLQRARALYDCASRVRRLRSEIESADSYAASGFERDAVRVYARVVAEHDALALALPVTHPQWAELRSLVDARERAAAYRKDYAARAAERNAAAVEAWRAGEGGAGSLAYELREAGPMLRVSRDGQRVETSWGADVPASVAPTLWAMIGAARAGEVDKVNAAVKRARVPVGAFWLDEVRPDGSLRIGCHDIAFSELQRIADAFGYAAHA